MGLAQALVHKPQLLVLDEPASGLDPGQRVEIRNLVKDLAQGDTTVILSTHVLPEVEAVCERVIIINKGRIVAQDSVDNLAGAGRSVVLKVARPDQLLFARLNALDGVEEVGDEGAGRYVLQASEDVREEAARAAVDFGLLELGVHQALEDVFLKLTREEAS